MATEDIAIKITADAGQANQSVGGLKAELKAATKELIEMTSKFGEASAEAEKAAKKVADLTDQIGDAKALAERFNPDKKFVALGGALQGAVAGFTALQGAIGVFGSESEGVANTIKKIQSAMALQEGISGVFAAVDSFKALAQSVGLATVATKAAKTAQLLWNAAMAANPISLLVTTIASVIAGIGALVRWFGESSAAAKKQAAAVNESAAAYERQKTAIQESTKALQADSSYLIELAKAQGKSTAEVRKLTLAEQDKKIALLEGAKAMQTAKLRQDEYALSTLKASGADEDFIKKQEENVKNQKELVQSTTKEISEGYEERLKLQRSFEIEDAQTAKKDADEKKKKDKEAKEKQIERNKERLKKIKEDNDEAEKKARELAQENFLLSIKDEQEKAEDKAFIDYENAIRELNASKASEENKAKVRKELVAKYQLEIRAIEDKAAAEKEKSDAEKEAKDKATKEEKDKAELERVKKFNEMMLAQDKEFKAKQVEAEKNLQTARYQAIDAGFELINALAGKNETVANILFAVQKGLEIGKIIVGAAASIAQIKFNIASVPPFLGPTPNPAYFVNLALGLKNIASVKIGAAAGIASIVASSISKFKGGGGAGVQAGGGTPAQPSGTIQRAPVTPQAQTTRIDQQQINQIGNAAVRSYVLETDVANNQERRIRIERAARIG